MQTFGELRKSGDGRRSWTDLQKAGEQTTRKIELGEAERENHQHAMQREHVGIIDEKR